MGFPDSSVGKEPTCNAGVPGLSPGREDPLERGWAPTPALLGFPGGSAGKESTCSAGDLVCLKRKIHYQITINAIWLYQNQLLQILYKN